MHKKINPKLQWCKCGYHWQPTTYQKIIMLIHGEYIKTCPRCHSKMHLVLINYVSCKKRENLDMKKIWGRG